MDGNKRKLAKLHTEQTRQLPHFGLTEIQIFDTIKLPDSFLEGKVLR